MADRADKVSPGSDFLGITTPMNYVGVPARALAAAEHHGPEIMDKE
jgi:hypothetical protein